MCYYGLGANVSCPIQASLKPVSPRHRIVDLHNDKMRLTTLVAGLFGLMATNVAATALTYKLTANELACFFASTKNENEKIAFYFAVSAAALHRGDTRSAHILTSEVH